MTGGLRGLGRAMTLGFVCEGTARSPASMAPLNVAPKQAELKDLATHLLTLAQSLLEQPQVTEELLDGARELANHGEMEIALAVLRIVKLDRLRAAAAKSLKAELRSMVRSRPLSPRVPRRW